MTVSGRGWLLAGFLVIGQAAQATQYDLTFIGTVTSSNACTYPSVTDCYAAPGSSVSFTFRYEPGAAAALQVPTQAIYVNEITSYTATLGGIGFSSTSTDPLGFGQFILARNAPTQGASTASVFSAYVAEHPAYYTYVATRATSFTSQVPTSAAVAGDNFYGNLRLAEIRINMGTLSSLFADLAVPTSVSTANLDPGTTNFGVTLLSDFFLGNQAGYTFGGGLTSVSVSPVQTAAPEGPTNAPEPASALVLLAGLAGLAARLRPIRRAVAPT